jgi:plasmid stabilization system protein ParE
LATRPRRGRRPLKNWSFTLTAFKDFQSITRYLEEHAVDSEGAANLLWEILAACDRLGEAPHSGSPRPELGPTIRSVAMNPYMIYHRVVGGQIKISRILHQRQDARRIFGRGRK